MNFISCPQWEEISVLIWQFFLSHLAFEGRCDLYSTPIFDLWTPIIPLGEVDWFLLHIREVSDFHPSQWLYILFKTSISFSQDDRTNFATFLYKVNKRNDKYKKCWNKVAPTLKCSYRKILWEFRIRVNPFEYYGKILYCL